MDSDGEYLESINVEDDDEFEDDDDEFVIKWKGSGPSSDAQRKSSAELPKAPPSASSASSASSSSSYSSSAHSTSAIRSALPSFITRPALPSAFSEAISSMNQPSFSHTLPRYSAWSTQPAPPIPAPIPASGMSLPAPPPLPSPIKPIGLPAPGSATPAPICNPVSSFPGLPSPSPHPPPPQPIEKPRSSAGAFDFDRDARTVELDKRTPPRAQSHTAANPAPSASVRRFPPSMPAASPAPTIASAKKKVPATARSSSPTLSSVSPPRPSISAFEVMAANKQGKSFSAFVSSASPPATNLYERPRTVPPVDDMFYDTGPAQSSGQKRRSCSLNPLVPMSPAAASASSPPKQGPTPSDVRAKILQTMASSGSSIGGPSSSSSSSSKMRSVSSRRHHHAAASSSSSAMTPSSSRTASNTSFGSAASPVQGSRLDFSADMTPHGVKPKRETVTSSATKPPLYIEIFDSDEDEDHPMADAPAKSAASATKQKTPPETKVEKQQQLPLPSASSSASFSLPTPPKPEQQQQPPRSTARNIPNAPITPKPASAVDYLLARLDSKDHKQAKQKKIEIAEMDEDQWEKDVEESENAQLASVFPSSSAAAADAAGGPAAGAFFKSPAKSMIVHAAPSSSSSKSKGRHSGSANGLLGRFLKLSERIKNIQSSRKPTPNLFDPSASAASIFAQKLAAAPSDAKVDMKLLRILRQKTDKGLCFAFCAVVKDKNQKRVADDVDSDEFTSLVVPESAKVELGLEENVTIRLQGPWHRLSCPPHPWPIILCAIDQIDVVPCSAMVSAGNSLTSSSVIPKTPSHKTPSRSARKTPSALRKLFDRESSLTSASSVSASMLMNVDSAAPASPSSDANALTYISVSPLSTLSLHVKVLRIIPTNSMSDFNSIRYKMIERQLEWLQRQEQQGIEVPPDGFQMPPDSWYSPLSSVTLLCRDVPRNSLLQIEIPADTFASLPQSIHDLSMCDLNGREMQLSGLHLERVYQFTTQNSKQWTMGISLLGQSEADDLSKQRTPHWRHLILRNNTAPDAFTLLPLQEQPQLPASPVHDIALPPSRVLHILDHQMQEFRAEHGRKRSSTSSAAAASSVSGEQALFRTIPPAVEFLAHKKRVSVRGSLEFAQPGTFGASACINLFDNTTSLGYINIAIDIMSIPSVFACWKAVESDSCMEVHDVLAECNDDNTWTFKTDEFTVFKPLSEAEMTALNNAEAAATPKPQQLKLNMENPGTAITMFATRVTDVVELPDLPGFLANDPKLAALISLSARTCTQCGSDMFPELPFHSKLTVFRADRPKWPLPPRLCINCKKNDLPPQRFSVAQLFCLTVKPEDPRNPSSISSASSCSGVSYTSASPIHVIVNANQLEFIGIPASSLQRIMQGHYIGQQELFDLLTTHMLKLKLMAVITHPRQDDELSASVQPMQCVVVKTWCSRAIFARHVLASLLR